jgi:ferredoxin-thioredoxin reductase catalytic subunit
VRLKHQEHRGQDEMDDHDQPECSLFLGNDNNTINNINSNTFPEKISVSDA